MKRQFDTEIVVLCVRWYITELWRPANVRSWHPGDAIVATEATADREWQLLAEVCRS